MEEKENHLTDLTFFTNEPGCTLLDRFKKTLVNNTKFFDVLVGYFRISGFYQLYESLAEVEKIRILIGISADIKTAELLSSKKIKTIHIENIEKEYEEENETKEIEIGTRKFIEFIENKKLEVRIHPSNQIHAKVYIIRKGEKSEDFGKVITGSSNFSYSGFVDNLEFNVELKDKRDVQFALSKFEELWNASRLYEITDEIRKAVKERTWLNDTITPYELYLKFLYEYLKEKLAYQRELEAQDLPFGFKKLTYQRDAVLDAIDKIKMHGGVFLSDVVGLGKTYVSALIAKELDGKHLVIAPPNLVQYWSDTFYNFNVPVKVESSGKIRNLLSEDLSGIKNIFIDEAHKYRNELTQSYESLQKIASGKRVILVTATPQNNKPQDIANQLYLFQNKRNSTMPNMKNIENFFRKIKAKEDELEKGRKKLSLSHKDYRRKFIDLYKENAKELREKILKYVIVRRTRGEIEKYYASDLRKAKVEFPQVFDPFQLYYKFDKDIDDLFNETIDIIKNFFYARYTPALFLEDKKAQYLTTGEDFQFQVIYQTSLKGLMKILLIKRLESSFYAFKRTINRFIESHKSYIDMYNKGIVLVSKKCDVVALLEEEDENKIEEAINKYDIIEYKQEEFMPEYINFLKKDLEKLEYLNERWELINKDPKLEKLIEVLKNEKNLQKRVIIFTESKETGDYLKENLSKTYKDKVLFISSYSKPSDFQEAIDNFDPNVLPDKQRNNIRILVTTEVLAEGVNLHKANVVMNYDIPWNPTRILQRVGRINRIGTEHSNIFVYNFFPTGQSEGEIGLEKRALAKLQAFHETLGEDAKYLMQEEEVSSHELFRKLTTKELFEEEKEESELEYLNFLKKVKEEEPEFFEYIKKLPKKARTAKEAKENRNSVITFFKRGYLKKFFISDELNEAKELDFFEAASILKTNKHTEKKSIIQDSYYKLLEQNKGGFDNAIKESEEESRVRLSKNENDFAKHIKALLNEEGLLNVDKDYLVLLKDVLEEGGLSKKTILDSLKRFEEERDFLKRIEFLKEQFSLDFLEKKSKERKEEIEKTEIILSEMLL